MSLGQAVVDVGADASGFERDLVNQVGKGADKAASRANASLAKIGRGTTQIGKRLSLGITTPLLGIAAASVKSSASFQQSMNLLGVNAGIGGKQLDAMGALAKKMGKDTIFSAGEAADAMLELSKAGFKPAQISGGGVQATMALAATEGLNLADAATITGNAMQAFGLKAKNAAQIADALAAGAVASTASVTSLSEGLGNVGPIARQSGLSLQDTVAALSELDQAGIKGAEGGTALRSFLTRLVPQGKRAKDAMAALGLSFTNADGSFKSFGQITEQLHQKLGKLTAAQKAERLQQIFGTYAKQAAAVFLSGGAKAYDKYARAVEKSGTAQKLSDARMKGTAGAIEQMRGSVDTAALALGDALAPTVVMVAGKIQKLANWFTDLSPAVQKDVAVVGALAAGLGPLLVIGGSMISTYSKLATAMRTFSGGTTTAVTGASRLATVSKGLAGTGGLLAVTDGMRRAGDSATKTGKAMGVLETAAGGAALGFAVGGPLGAGVGAIAGGMFGLIKATDSAASGFEHFTWESQLSAKSLKAGFEPAVKSLTATLEGNMAAVGNNTRALELERQTKTGLLNLTQGLNISDRDSIQAALGNEAARRRVNAALQQAVAAGHGYQALKIAQGINNESDALYAARRAQLVKNEAMAGTRAEAERIQKKIEALDRAHANPKVRLDVGKTYNQLSTLRGMIADLTGTTHVVSMKVNVTGKPPSSMGALLGAGSNASGSDYWRGGWTMVGEQGRELVRLPRGAQILSNPSTERAISNASRWTPDSGRPVSPMPDMRLAPSQTYSSSSDSHARSASLTIINPVPETTTQSLPRALSNLAFIMGG